MKDEIKEILQLIGNCCYHGEISEDKCKKYCDYITNLEQENERLNIQIEMAFKKAYPFVVENGIICRKNKEIDDYKSRINKAREYMNNYIKVEDAPINERIKIEFKEVIKKLGGDEE